MTSLPRKFFNFSRFWAKICLFQDIKGQTSNFRKFRTSARSATI